MGGDLLKGVDGNIEYNGGVRGFMWIEHDMRYEEFIVRACHRMNNPEGNLTFAFTLTYDLFAPIPLKNNDYLNFLTNFNEHFT